ncbi:hypothetical protein ACFL4G_10095 [Thermodesulfobacteriota bacterium]
MTTFDGDAPEDRSLWHTYLFLAKQHAISVGGHSATGDLAIADDPANRISDRLAEALQTILFSSFVLEYRLKRVLHSMGATPKPKETLGPLFDRFWSALQSIDRCDGKGKCVAPAEWSNCEPTLRKLIFLRNKMAHANYSEVLTFFGQAKPAALAIEYYNVVVEAIKLINFGTGYETRPLDVVEEYFQPLHVLWQDS